MEPLRAMTGYFNLSTDVVHGKLTNRQRRKITKEYEAPLQSLRTSMSKDAPPAADLMPIEVRDMSFSYQWAQPILTHVSASSPQGSIVVVDGHGRTTLLR